MQVNLTLTPGYRLKISRASRMSELVDRTITGLAALGGSAAFLEILRRWFQRRQEKRQEQLQLDVRIMEEGHALRQEAYQREREALKALAEERERRHKAELAALEAQMQAKLEAMTERMKCLLGAWRTRIDLDRHRSGIHYKLRSVKTPKSLLPLCVVHPPRRWTAGAGSRLSEPPANRWSACASSIMIVKCYP
jgi:hypothetical protein